MATNIKNLPDTELVLPGNGACAGCPATLALRMAGKALGQNAIMCLTPSCSVASMGMTPRMGFNWPALNITFASAGASASGITTALEALMDKGAITGEKPTVFNWVGDGGTYDIGFQALSAAAERNDDIIHFCYNNESYSNTGMQRSGATPRGAYTTTTPEGKSQARKNMSLLMLDHNIPYAATASISHPGDLYDKVMKAKSIRGFKYIEIFAPCYTGWGFPSGEVVDMGKEAVKTGAWLLWEAENGHMRFSAPSDAIVSGKTERKSIDEYLKRQARFRRVFKEGNETERIAALQADIDREMRFMAQRATMG